MFDAELKAAKAVALQAGPIMREYFDGGQGVKHKLDGTVVTVADKAINRLWWPSARLLKTF